MLSRIAPLRRLLITAPRFKEARAKESTYCQPHMNELPVACHKWEDIYDPRQSTFNKILIGGVVWFLFSAFMMIATDSFKLNFFPPKFPAPPTEMVSDCDDE